MTTINDIFKQFGLDCHLCETLKKHTLKYNPTITDYNHEKNPQTNKAIYERYSFTGTCNKEGTPCDIKLNIMVYDNNTKLHYRVEDNSRFKSPLNEGITIDCDGNKGYDLG